MPQPLTYTDAAREHVLMALRAGSSMRDAVGFAGVEWRTFLHWLKAGRRYVELGADADGADVRFAQLAREVDQAMHASSVALTSIMRTAANAGDWRAADRLLTHRSERQRARADLRRARADATVAEQRAAGTLIDRTDVTSGGAPMLAFYVPRKRADDDDGSPPDDPAPVATE